MNTSGKIIFKNIIYIIFLFLIYGKNFILDIEILVTNGIIFFLEMMQSENINEINEFVKNSLEIFDQNLRIGMTPSIAYEKMLKTQEIDHAYFKKSVQMVSKHAFVILDFIKSDFSFNYRVFKKQSYMIIKEIETDEAIRKIYRKNIMQIEIMKFLPLLMLVLLLKEQNCDLTTCSISLWLIFFINVLNFNFFRLI